MVMGNLRKFAVVFRREYLERVRSKWFVIGTLLGPVFFGMITIFPMYLSSRQRPAADLANVIVLDATSSGLGARVAASLGKAYPESPAPQLRSVTPERLLVAEDAATIAVVKKDVVGYIVIDSNTVANRSVRYAGRNASSLNDVEKLLGNVRQAVLAQRLEAEGLNPDRVAALTAQRLRTVTEKIGSKGRENGSGMGNFIFGYLVAFLLYMMIVLYGQTILRGVMEEKTTRVAEVVVSSVSTDVLLAGKVLGVGLVAITQVVSWVVLSGAMLVYLGPLLASKMGPAGATATTAGGLPLAAVTSALPSPGVALVILAYFVLGFIFYSALFAAVGAMVSSQEDVQQASMPVMIMLVSSVVFMTPILTNPSSALARTMSLIPFSAPILMPLRMTLIQVPWYELVASLAGVTLACVVSIWISARIYRVGLLMYGKRPSFAELARWVRYAG